MQSSTTTIIALLIAGVLLFIVPVVTLTERSDNVTQEAVKLIVEEFVTDVKNTGKLTRERYQQLETDLDATGNNVFAIDLIIQRSGENEGKKKAQLNYIKIGEFLYGAEYTTQTLKQIGIKVDDDDPSTEDTLLLNEGEYIYLEVKNVNSTAAQTTKSSVIGFSNADEYTIYASSSGMVTVNGVRD